MRTLIRPLLALALFISAAAPAAAQIVVEPMNPILRERPADTAPAQSLHGRWDDAPRQVAEIAVAKAMISGSPSRVFDEGRRATVSVTVAGRGRCKVDLVLLERGGLDPAGTEWRVAQLVCP